MKKFLYILPLMAIIFVGIFTITNVAHSAFLSSICDQSNESTLGIPSSECLILKDFYDRTNGDNWNNNTNWGTISSVDSWNGITVFNGHVTGMSLSSNGLSGNIGSWNIAGLPEMFEFYLQNNQLTGNISSWNIASLDSLAGFAIFNNQLTGDLSSSNWNISNLTGLYYFYINDNNFSGDISYWNISNLTHLMHFVLRSNNFTGDLTTWDISNLTDLAFFYLNDNNFTGNLTSWNLTNLTHLEIFYISNNNFSGDIPDFDSNGMIYFVTNDNAFTFSNLEPRISKINSAGTHNYSPQAKVDTKNRLVNVNDGETLTITPELPVNSSGNDSYEWFKDGVSLGSSSTSNRIFTKNNVTPNDGGAYTYKVTNANVSGLVLESHNIVVTVVDAGDTTSPQLTVVNAVMSPTNDSTPSFTFSTDENGTIDYTGSCSGDTNTAIIGNNTINLTSSDGNSLGDGTYSDCVLTVTDASGNTSDQLPISDFTVDTSISFPDAVCDQNNEGILGISTTECDILKSLYKSTNGDSWNDHSNWGTISSVNTWSGVVIDNGHVTKLNLNNNNLNGNIGSLDISNLANLKNVHFGNNQLSGDIGSWNISNLTDLETFRLGNNQLSGDIHAWDISGLINLTDFTIRNNLLNGNISSWDISSLTQIKYFNIGQNNFTGDIRYWDVSGLTKLRGFHVNNNRLTGDIGSWNISGLTNLNLFYLNNNQLTGNISSWDVSSCKQLREFIISNNQLTGYIPNFDTSTGNMTYFEIENNKFTFSNIEPMIGKINTVAEHSYQPQHKVDTDRTINLNDGETLTITPELPVNSSGNDSYEWFKDGVSLGPGSTSNRIFTLNNVTLSDIGTYTYQVTNFNVSGLILESNNIVVNVVRPPTIQEVIEQTDATITQLLVTFDQDMAAASASNRANFRLLEAGSSNGFQTTGCVGSVDSGDNEIPFSSLSYDSTSRTTSLTMATLPGGTYRLYACTGLQSSTSVALASDYSLDFTMLDTDHDGLVDDVDNDDDGDGMPDTWEIANGTNPLVADDAGDPDGDGWTNLQEYMLGTNPNNNDTDFDGVLDGVDNCPVTANADQADDDGDRIGDVCDTATADHILCFPVRTSTGTVTIICM